MNNEYGGDAVSARRAVAKRFLPLMTQTEAHEAAIDGATVLLPVGTVEANGPHMPLGLDYLVAEALAARVASQAEALWLPPIAYGVSGPLMAFPGSIAIDPDVLSRQIETVLRSLIATGFEHIVLLCNHIPNRAPAELACRRVRHATGVLVPSILPASIASSISESYSPPKSTGRVMAESRAPR